MFFFKVYFAAFCSRFLNSGIFFQTIPIRLSKSAHSDIHTQIHTRTHTRTHFMFQNCNLLMEIASCKKIVCFGVWKLAFVDMQGRKSLEETCYCFDYKGWFSWSDWLEWYWFLLYGFSGLPLNSMKLGKRWPSPGGRNSPGGYLNSYLNSLKFISINMVE